MLEIDNSRFIFKSKEIWFCEIPFDIIGYDSVIFRECTKDVQIKGFSKEKFTTLVIDLTQDLDTIWNKMQKSSCRRIKKIMSDNIVVIRVNQDYHAFYKLNSEFRKLKGLPKYDVDIDYMKKNGILFTSEFQGKIIGGQYYLSDGKNIRWLLGASRRLENTNIGSIIASSYRLIIWEAIKYAKGKGMITFDMGGYYTGEKPDIEKEGINDFKKSFGGELVTHYIYQKDYSTIYYVLKKIFSLKQLLKVDFS